MNIKLLIENQVVDLLAEGNFVLQVNSNVAGSIENIVTSRSFTLICPFTPQNSIIFQHLELPSKTGDWLTSYKNAVVQVDGLQIFKGKAILLKIGVNGYEIALNFGELTALASLILDKRKISELGFTEEWKEWLPSTAFDVTKKDVGFYNYNFGASNFGAGGLIPIRNFANQSYSIQFQYLITKISEFYGLDIQTPNLTNDYLILAKNYNARVAENPNIRFTSFIEHLDDFRPTAYYNSEIGINYLGFQNDFLPNIRFVDTNLRSIMTDMSKVKGLRVTCLSLSNPYLPEFDRYDFVITAADNYSEILISHPMRYAGDTYFIPIQDLPDKFAAWPKYIDNPFSGSTSIDVLVEFEFKDGQAWPLSDKLTYYVAESIAYTYQQFPVFANCDFTALQFIKECQLLSGLFTRQGVTNSEIVLEGLTRLADRSNALDLTEKLVSLIPSEFVFDDWAKLNTFKFQEYTDFFTSEYGDSEINLTYLNLPENKALKSTFGTGYEYKAGSLLKIPQWTRNELEITFNDIPLIYAKYISEPNPTQSVPRIRTIHFSEILNNANYQVLIDKLESLRVMDAEFFLSNLEFKRLNVNLPIYLKQAGKYFFIISADYDVNTSILKARILKV